MHPRGACFFEVTAAHINESGCSIALRASGVTDERHRTLSMRLVGVVSWLTVSVPIRTIVSGSTIEFVFAYAGVCANAFPDQGRVRLVADSGDGCLHARIASLLSFAVSRGNGPEWPVARAAMAAPGVSVCDPNASAPVDRPMTLRSEHPYAVARLDP